MTKLFFITAGIWFVLEALSTLGIFSLPVVSAVLALIAGVSLLIAAAK